MIIPFFIFLKGLCSKKQESVYPIKLTDSAYLTPNGIVDFNKPAELTDAQRFHNAMVDFEVEVNEREFQQREEIAKLTGSINLVGRKKVIAIKYVA